GEFGVGGGAVPGGRGGVGMAGVGPADVPMCQIYDCYTYTVLVTLEDYGFCPKGEGGPFAASGALAPGGSLPVNTGGGQLSAYYMWGFTPLSEAIVQGRGDGGDRQSAATDVILVSGNGGILGHAGTLGRSPHRSERGRGQNRGDGRDGRDAAGMPGRVADATAGQDGPGTTRESGGSDGAAAARGLSGPDEIGVVHPDARDTPF